MTPRRPRFVTVLLTRVIDDAHDELVQDFIYFSALTVTSEAIVVPAGFVTDYSSVPRLPFMYWFFGGRAKRPAVIHDYLYATQHLPRQLADAIFYEAMQLDGRRWAQRWSMWAGVRAGGWKAWRDDRRKS